MINLSESEKMEIAREVLIQALDSANLSECNYTSRDVLAFVLGFFGIVGVKNLDQYIPERRK